MRVLDPYILLFSNLDKQNTQRKGLAQIKSPQYRVAMFEIKLLGSDAVVSALNDIMQYFYKLGEDTQTADPRETLTKWGQLLLAIRKDLGSQRTKLTPHDMLRGEIKDIDEYLTK